jgi:hypothetical protein
MKDFIPSGDFVEKTMVKIHEVSLSGHKPALARLPFVFIRIAQIAAAAFGMALGAVNLARLYMTVFAPIVCH